MTLKTSSEIVSVSSIEVDQRGDMIKDKATKLLLVMHNVNCDKYHTHAQELQ